jgi:hypothetical protein
VPNLIVSAVSTFDNKGLRKGQKEISAFDKTLKTLGKTFIGVFGAQKLLQFSKNAVKAFAADEKAAKSLSVQLTNLGYGFATSGIEDYIAKLEKSTGVLDDHLRPAFQTLLTTTGLVTESQKALQVALDTSAATGMSLESVSDALAAGYRGQTKALRALGVNLSKTALSAGNMAVALKEIGAAYSGQAAARLDTYAGKMDLLEGAASRATETIGKGLLDSLALLSKDDSIQGAADDMEYFAKKVADATYGMAALLAKTDRFTGLDKISTDTLFAVSNPLLALLAKYGASERPNTGRSNRTYQGGQTSNTNYVLRKKEADAIKKANAARAAELALLTKKSELDKLKDKFDVERIGLMAALNAATDEETKLRLRAQIAILDNNEALAKKINAELEAAKSASDLAKSFGGASSSLELNIAKLRSLSDTILQKAAIKGIETPGVFNPYAASGGSSSTSSALETQIQKLQSLTDIIKQKAALKGIDTSTVDYSIMPTLPNGMLDLTAPQNAASARLQAQADAYFKNQQEIKLTIDTTNTGDRFAQLIAESLQAATKSGLSSTPVGLP